MFKRPFQSDEGSFVTPCANCGTRRYPIKARGHCTRCYPLILRLDWIDKWRLEEPRTLRGYPGNSIFWNRKTFELLKWGYAAQLRERLSFLRRREEQRNLPLRAIDVEYLLRSISRHARAAGDVHYGVATTIAQTFPPKERQMLFRLLHDIEERIRWPGPGVGWCYDNDPNRKGRARK